jgi:hypothetical protein
MAAPKVVERRDGVAAMERAVALGAVASDAHSAALRVQRTVLVFASVGVTVEVNAVVPVAVTVMRRAPASTVAASSGSMMRSSTLTSVIFPSLSLRVVMVTRSAAGAATVEAIDAQLDHDQRVRTPENVPTAAVPIHSRAS